MLATIEALYGPPAWAMPGADAGGRKQPIMREDVHYGSDPQQVLDLCLPATGDNAPAMVMIHGGAWRHLDKKSYHGLCHLAATQGVVAASINYRLATLETNRWPDQIVDVQLAIRWLRSHAQELRLDSNHICSFGHSAGAHLAVLAGTEKDTVAGDAAGELSGVSSAVECVVDHAGPVDLTDPAYHPPERELFGTQGRTRDPQAERSASPLFLVSAQTPPMLVIHGRSDPGVPIEQAERLIDALRNDKVPVQVIFYAGDHGLSKVPLDEKRAIAAAEIGFIKSPDQPIANPGYAWQQ